MRPRTVDHEQRVERLRRLASAAGVRAVAVTLPEHVFYLTGCEPHRDYPARLLVTETDVRGLWPDEIPRDLPAWVACEAYQAWECHGGQTSPSGLAPSWRALAGAVPDLADDQLEGRELFRRLMRRKEPAEIEAVEANVHANDRAFEAVAGMLGPGSSGLEIAGACLSVLADDLGAPVSWEGCVGVGERGDFFDAQPDAEQARDGDAVFVDLYPRRRHYAGDSTRTFAVGAPEAWMRDAHDALVRALEAVERLLRPGAAAADLDAACRGLLDEYGGDGRFAHHSGHGLGVFAQEPPYLIPGSEDVLEEGDVVAVEPGLYVPGVGGMRLEDAFEIVEGGSRRLNAAPRELVICG